MLESFFAEDKDLEYTGWGNTLLQDIFFCLQMVALVIGLSILVFVWDGIPLKQVSAYFGL